MLQYRDGVGRKGDDEVAQHVLNDDKVGSRELEAMGGGNELKRRCHELYAKAVKGRPGTGWQQGVGVRGSSLIMRVTSLTSRSSEEENMRSCFVFLVRHLLVNVVRRLIGVVACWCLRLKAGSWMG
jgi:hypothetical protein